MLFIVRMLKPYASGRGHWRCLQLIPPGLISSASHDGIGLNPLRGILPESEILSLVEKLQQEGATVNWKNNPDGTRSPYEINVTYLDALSLRDSSDDERIARFIPRMLCC